MTENVQQTTANVESKISDKELNFRAMEAKYQRQIEEERRLRSQAELRAQELLNRKQQIEEDDEDSEPYVDHKRLDKKLTNFERKLEEKIEKKAEEKARILLEKDKKETWIRSNPDFYDILQHADKFAQHDPDLAESILQMPEGFERQKLVYKNIKALGLHKPHVKESSIQEKIDANRRSPYYQPSGIGTAPYQSAGDFSVAGQKNAYDKMKELKSRLRLG